MKISTFLLLASIKLQAASEYNSSDEEALLAHNDARFLYVGNGVNPLVWNDSLAIDSLKYADLLAADQCALEHLEETVGENLATSQSNLSKDLFSVTGAVNLWVREGIPEYGSFNHWTQVYWRTTFSLGCGVSYGWKLDGIQNLTCNVIVCRYYPPGNCADNTFLDDVNVCAGIFEPPIYTQIKYNETETLKNQTRFSPKKEKIDPTPTSDTLEIRDTTPTSSSLTYKRFPFSAAIPCQTFLLLFQIVYFFLI